MLKAIILGLLVLATACPVVVEADDDHAPFPIVEPIDAHSCLVIDPYTMPPAYVIDCPP